MCPSGHALPSLFPPLFISLFAYSSICSLEGMALGVIGSPSSIICQLSDPEKLLTLLSCALSWLKWGTKGGLN